MRELKLLTVQPRQWSPASRAQEAHTTLAKGSCRWRGPSMLRAWVPRAGRRAAAGWWLLPQEQVGTAPASQCLSLLLSSLPPLRLQPPSRLIHPHLPPPRLQPSSPLLQPQSRHLHVLFRDPHIIVTNKAAGVLSQPDRQMDGVATDQLGLVRAHIKETRGKPGEAYVGLVHRLDRNVTGCMVIALRSKAAARLSYDFKHRLVSKTYVCMVVGKLRGAGMLADTLEHDQKNVTRVLGGGMKKEKQRKGLSDAQGEEQEKEAKEKALLHYKALGVFQHPQAGAQTLVQIRLVTGKKHQIRAQLSHLGHPIVGDVKYNAPTRFRDKFLALHCCTISFRHPSVESPASRDENGDSNEKVDDGTLGKPTDQKPQRRKITVHAPLPETWRARFGDEVVWLVEELQRSTGEQQLPRP